jgi:hypothetical protein
VRLGLTPLLLVPRLWILLLWAVLRWTLLLVLAGLAPPAWAAGASGKGGKASNDIVIEGRVTSVVDGDSLWVTPADNSAANCLRAASRGALMADTSVARRLHPAQCPCRAR